MLLSYMGLSRDGMTGPVQRIHLGPVALRRVLLGYACMFACTRSQSPPPRQSA